MLDDEIDYIESCGKMLDSINKSASNLEETMKGIAENTDKAYDKLLAIDDENVRKLVGRKFANKLERIESQMYDLNKAFEYGRYVDCDQVIFFSSNFIDELTEDATESLQKEQQQTQIEKKGHGR